MSGSSRRLRSLFRVLFAPGLALAVVLGAGVLAYRQKDMTGADVIAAVGVAGALLAFIAGLQQYRIGDEWKRAEWVGAEAARFLQSRAVRTVLSCLDWSQRYVQLQVHSTDDTFVWVDDATVKEALRQHKDGETFTRKEAALRDDVGEFFDGLGRFWIMIERKLVDIEEVRPHLEYWVKIVAGDDEAAIHKPNDYLEALWTFADVYQYEGARRLVQRLTEGRCTRFPDRIKASPEELRPMVTRVDALAISAESGAAGDRSGIQGDAIEWHDSL